MTFPFHRVVKRVERGTRKKNGLIGCDLWHLHFMAPGVIAGDGPN